MESRVNSIKIAQGQAPTTYTGASTTYHQVLPLWTTCYYKQQLNPDQTTADIMFVQIQLRIISPVFC